MSEDCFLEPTLPMIPHLKFVALEVVFKSQEMIFEQKNFALLRFNLSS